MYVIIYLCLFFFYYLSTKIKLAVIRIVAARSYRAGRTADGLPGAPTRPRSVSHNRTQLFPLLMAADRCHHLRQQQQHRSMFACRGETPVDADDLADDSDVAAATAATKHRIRWFAPGGSDDRRAVTLQGWLGSTASWL